FAVQIAKAYGARVTGVCSAKNESFVKSLGADHVIPYDKENIHRHNGQYDLVIDTNGNLSFSDFQRMGKRGVLIGFTTLSMMLGVILRKTLNKYPLSIFTAEANTKDLEVLVSLVRERKIQAHIDKIYPAHEIPKAIEYI